MRVSSVQIDWEGHISGMSYRKHLQKLCHTQLCTLMPSKQAGHGFQKTAEGFEKKD